MQRLRRRIRLRRRQQTVYPDIHINDRTANRPSRYPTNNITTTKYTVLNFIPKNLIEQFRRVTNVYFLIVVIITLIPAISPLNPATSIAPLVFVLGVTALKEAYEDFLRYKADARVNGKKVTVHLPGGKRRLASRDLQVGDIVELHADETVPADVIPLCADSDVGIVYVETAQLDGETYLKKVEIPKEMQAIGRDACISMTGTATGEMPNAKLEDFSGSVSPNGHERVGYGKKQLLLRGTQVRRTPWVVGIVAYTGVQTKLSLNQKKPPSKFSTVERRLNKCVIAIFTFKMFCVAVVTALTAYFHAVEAPDAWYLDYDENPAFEAVKNFFSYFALLSFMIPMSLMVTLEVVKVIQGSYMDWDRKMAQDPKNTEETGCQAKTSNLNDELALVQYVFSDKTGTLTSNCMVFDQCTINGVVYTNAGQGQLKEEVARGGDEAEWIHEYLVTMALCHEVDSPEKRLPDGRYVYQAESPDEKALVEGAETNGYVYCKSDQDGVTMRMPDGSTVQYEVLRRIVFTSDRRRSSVLLRLPNGQIRLYTKGADTVMGTYLNSSERTQRLKQKTFDDIEQFCKTGLRTLIFGYRDLSQEEADQFMQRYQECMSYTGKEREDKLDEVNKDLECGLELIGASAIEDKLQDDVPGTIHNLLVSGIRVWMITGDKLATAENIALSCRLLSRSMDLIKIDSMSSREAALDALRSEVVKHCEGERNKKQMGLVIHGDTLHYVFELTKEEKDAKQKRTALAEPFLKLAMLCHSVVCCRVTPLQKAKIVKLMKEHTKCVSLSIGDGANDVSMIQEAHIGVGIFGKEGTQAARSADYAIREFRHLRRLLTVHGRWSFVRNATLIQYYIYKNAAFFLVQFWYAFYCGYSAQTIYDDWIVTMFNILFTSIPPFFYAIFEKDIDEDVIDEYPESHRNIQSGKLFTYSTLCTWMLLAIWHSLVFFFGPVLVVANEPFVFDGKTHGLRTFGTMAAACGITTVVMKIAIESNTWNVFVHFGIWGSIVSYWIFTLGESFLAGFVPTQYWQIIVVASNPNFWCLYVFTILVCLGPDMVFNFMKRQLYPEDWMVLQEARKTRKLSATDVREMNVKA